MRDGQSTYRLRLAALQLSTLLQLPEIRLRVADYKRTRTILSAEITAPVANCGYAARSGATFPNNDSLLFVRQETCAPIPNGAQDELVLTVTLNQPGPIAVWTAPPAAPGRSNIEILVADRTEGSNAGRAIVGTVGYSDTSKGRSRLALLNYVWQISPSSWWLIALTAFGTVIVGVAAYLLTDACVLSGEIRLRTKIHSTIAGTCGALALALVYAYVVPPFQAADESHHFAALATFLKEPELDSGARLLAQRGHFDRIVFHPDQHFNPSDVGHLGPILTTAVIPRSDVRGEGIFAVWYAFAPLLRGHSAGTTLFLTRALNAVVFSISVGLFVYLIAVFTQSRFPILGAFPLFIIPTLPFFGMQVSNYAPLCAAYIILTAGVMLFVWDGRGSDLSGLLMGSSWTAATVLSRSAIPMAPLLLGCATARILMGPRKATVGAAVTFWVGLAFSSAVALFAIPPPLRELARITSTGLPPGLRGIWLLADHAWALTLIGTAGVAVELLLHRQHTGADPSENKVAIRLLRIAAYGAAVSIGVLIVGSVFIEYPYAPMIDPQHPPAAGQYVLRMLLSASTMFRLTRPDFLTSQSFWSGFGWLDTALPNWTVIFLAASTGAALMLTMVLIAKRGALRSGAHVFLVMAGLVVAFLTSSFAVVRSTPADLHGRYLMGIYVCLVVLCWHCLSTLTDEARPPSRNTVLMICGFSVLAIHGIAFVTILQRYFG